MLSAITDHTGTVLLPDATNPNKREQQPISSNPQLEHTPVALPIKAWASHMAECDEIISWLYLTPDHKANEIPLGPWTSQYAVQYDWNWCINPGNCHLD